MSYQQLPFPIDRYLQQPYQIDVNRPPFTPQVQCVPWLQPYLPYLTGVMMDFIQTRALVQPNEPLPPISTFLYNAMSQNNWQNQEFVNAVADCADYIFLENQNYVPTQHNIGQVIERGVVSFVELRSMYCVTQCPALWNYIQPQDQRRFQDAQLMYENLQQQVYQLRSQSPMGVPVGQPVMAQRGPVGYTPAYANASTNAMGMQNTYQRGSSPMGMGPSMGRPAPGGGRSYGDAGGVVQPVQQAPVPQPLVQPQQQPLKAQQPMMTQSQQSAQQASTSTELVDSDKHTWQFNLVIPYPLAHNPITDKLWYSFRNGVNTPVLQPREDLNMIDYNRHEIGTIFGKPPIGSTVVLDNNKANNLLAQGIADIEAEMAHVDENNAQVEYVLTCEHVLTDVNLANALMSARVEMLALNKEVPMVYRIFSNVYTPILTDNSEHELIQSLATSTSFIELREKLKAAGETHSIELVTELINRATWLMNHILHRHLSIPPAMIEVEDFIDDLDGLLLTLRTTAPYNESVEKAFLKNQRQLIKSLYGTLDPSDPDEIEAYVSLANDVTRRAWPITIEKANDEPNAAIELVADKSKPMITFVGQSFSITLVDIISHDLQIKGIPDIGNGLSSKFTPVLYKLADNIFAAEKDTTMLISRRFIVTKDNRVLEVTKGELSGNFYCISLEK